MSNVESIDAGDVRRVAKYNKVNLTTDQVIRILDDYPAEQRKDPTATWDLVVEDQIQNIANIPVRPKKKRKDTINGRNIKQLYTIGSMYANGNVDVVAGIGTELPLRIHVSELVKLMKGRTFKMVPKRDYAYLEVV